MPRCLISSKIPEISLRVPNLFIYFLSSPKKAFLVPPQPNPCRSLESVFDRFFHPSRGCSEERERMSKYLRTAQICHPKFLLRPTIHGLRRRAVSSTSSSGLPSFGFHTSQRFFPRNKGFPGERSSQLSWRSNASVRKGFLRGFSSCAEESAGDPPPTAGDSRPSTDPNPNPSSASASAAAILDLNLTPEEAGLSRKQWRILRHKEKRRREREARRKEWEAARVASGAQELEAEKIAVAWSMLPPACPGCGAVYEKEDPEAPGYIDPRSLLRQFDLMFETETNILRDAAEQQVLWKIHKEREELESAMNALYQEQKRLDQIAKQGSSEEDAAYSILKLDRETNQTEELGILEPQTDEQRDKPVWHEDLSRRDRNQAIPALHRELTRKSRNTQTKVSRTALLL